MTVRVRVKNFQSIADSTVDISGLTVVTGQNNSGKSALIRAIAAMATNESAKGLLRNGEKTLSVELSFADGTHVKWEKGGTTNQYTLNGKVFSGVGSGVPEEIKALGLGPVEAGGQEIWPQVAAQFKGSLFLLDKSGAVFAEAVSDVERVGLLAEASRKAESDARSAKSEYKVRQADVGSTKSALLKFQGLGELQDQVDALREIERKSQKVRDLHVFFARLKETLETQHAVIRRYSPVSEVQFPEIPGIGDLVETLALQREMVRQNAVKARYGNLPELPELPEGFSDILSLRKLRDTILLSRKRAAVKPPEINVPETLPVDKFERFLALYQGLKKSQREYVQAVTLAKEAAVEYEKVAEEYLETLRGMGVCPTCGTPCGEIHL